MQNISTTTRRTPLVVGIALASVVAITPIAGAEVTGDLGGFFARDCVEVSAIVSVPPADADAVLPGGYTSSSFVGLPGGPGLSGDSSLLMGVETCQTAVIDGVPFDGPFSFGERVLSVERRDSTSGYHFYAVEQVTDDPRIYDLLSGAGFDIAYLPGVGASADAAGGVSEGGSVRIVDQAPLPPLPSPLDRVSIWRETHSGTKVLRLTVHNPTAQVGIGRVSAEASSAMASLLGTHEATGLGAINRFDFEARVQSVSD